MSKPIFEDLFTFKGRRNRQSYIYLQLSLAVIALVGIGFATAVTYAAPTVGAVLWFVVAVGLIAILVASWAAMSQRIRDFNQSGVWSLIILIPYIGPLFSFALWFIPSTEGDNQYGPSCI